MAQPVLTGLLACAATAGVPKAASTVPCQRLALLATARAVSLNEGQINSSKTPPLKNTSTHKSVHNQHFWCRPHCLNRHTTAAHQHHPGSCVPQQTPQQLQTAESEAGQCAQTHSSITSLHRFLSRPQALPPTLPCDCMAGPGNHQLADVWTPCPAIPRDFTSLSRQPLHHCWVVVRDHLPQPRGSSGSSSCGSNIPACSRPNTAGCRMVERPVST